MRLPTERVGSATAAFHRGALGLTLAAAGAGGAFVVQGLVPAVPAAAAAVALGAVLANLRAVPAASRPGLAIASGIVLKAGIVLLGFELVAVDMLRLGARGLGVVVAVVAATFVATLWAGRRLGISEPMSLLVATGFSICGVSAIAATREVVAADEEEVAYSIALVTLCGSLAIVVLPPLRGVLGLDPRSYGAWVGASVHDVAQVVATSSTAGGVALATAVVVKLTRVLMLGPLVTLVSRSRGVRGVGASRFVPPFILAFVGAATLRSAGVVPAGLLDPIATAKGVMFALALFSVGTRVDVRRLLTVGSRPLLLGFGSWAIIAVVAYLGIELVWA